MKCPLCGSKNAYIGLSDIDCPNESCQHFKTKPPAAVDEDADLDDILDAIIGSTKGGGAITISTGTSAGGTGTGTSAGGIGSISIGGGGIAIGVAARLKVDIRSTTNKLNSIEISFVADGDPGYADKQVEFYWSLNNSLQNICTLSHRCRYYVDGVNADGVTVYTTHWKCVHDGIQPSDAWSITAKIT